ncbi:MAG: radical SAM protein [Methanoregulaceae archaeon]|nr:radical SAM protein [Methanoregulaceae archaeon]
MIVSEIFRSLQGEGRNQGRICTFIRLTGCNLSCTWCDTEYAKSEGDQMPMESVVDEVHRLGRGLICITGGEPLLQLEDVMILVERLHWDGYKIEIETNGTITFRDLQKHASICMDVKCPSSGEESDLSLLKDITTSDSVKFVVGDLPDCEYAGEVMTEYRMKGEVFLSPVFGSDYSAAANFVITHDLPVRFQLQLHRLIGVR